MIYILRIISLIIILTLTVTSTWAGGNKNKGINFSNGRVCSTIAVTAQRACENDIRDDYWISYGNCINTDDKLAVKECLEEVRAQFKEDHELCGDQKEARLNICEALGEAPYQPEIDPDLFLNPEEIAANPNPYFPLVPGLVRILEAGDETITVTVTEETVEILGVTCIVVRDIVEEDGETIEDTIDWYAQDVDGNVWYFGEISKNFEDGELNNLDGSWKSGVDDAQPGIVMLAFPEVGDIYRQEYLLGEAEDMAEVISTSETWESVPAADCLDTCLVTSEFLPIEPDVEEFKYYAPGIGNILVIDAETGEREELVEVIIP